MRLFFLVSLIMIFKMTVYNQNKYYFPLGLEMLEVKQQDTSNKKVFVLGVYASAIHVKWLDENGKIFVKALAVASEPYIFWRGENKDVDSVIKKINLPEKHGKLVPADVQFNGPSGKSLDENYLTPLNFSREDAWLCDLIPHSLMNSSQKNAIERVKNKFPELVKNNIPTKPSVLADSIRLNEILNELKKSKASVIILLGDLPIKYFLPLLTNKKYKSLSDFENYGEPLHITFEGKDYMVYAPDLSAFLEL